MTAPDDDEKLMERFRQGDESAFDRLYERHATGVHAFLRGMVRDAALAEDLLQTTFLSFVRARGRYQFSTGVRSWIFAIAANAGRDALRRRAVRSEDLLSSAAGERALANTAAPEVSWPDPGASRALEAALMKLPADQREAVLLHKLHGFSFAEIADALGISQTAAKVRAHRGYEKLKALLAPLQGSSTGR